MFEKLKHTFTSFEDHLRKMWSHTETGFKVIEEETDLKISEMEARLLVEIKTAEDRLRSEFSSPRTLPNPVQNIEPAPMIAKVPEVATLEHQSAD